MFLFSNPWYNFWFIWCCVGLWITPFVPDIIDKKQAVIVLFFAGPIGWMIFSLFAIKRLLIYVGLMRR